MGEPGYEASTGPHLRPYYLPTFTQFFLPLSIYMLFDARGIKMGLTVLQNIIDYAGGKMHWCTYI